MAVGTVANRRKMAKHFELKITATPSPIGATRKALRLKAGSMASRSCAPACKPMR